MLTSYRILIINPLSIAIILPVAEENSGQPSLIASYTGCPLSLYMNALSIGINTGEAINKMRKQFSLKHETYMTYSKGHNYQLYSSAGHSAGGLK